MTLISKLLSKVDSNQKHTHTHLHAHIDQSEISQNEKSGLVFIAWGGFCNRKKGLNRASEKYKSKSCYHMLPFNDPHVVNGATTHDTVSLQMDHANLSQKMPKKRSKKKHSLSTSKSLLSTKQILITLLF